MNISAPESAQKVDLLIIEARASAPALFSGLSELLSLSRKKKGWVSGAICWIGAGSLCGSSWDFSSRSKAVAVWLTLQRLVGVGTYSWAILVLWEAVRARMCVSVCVSVVLGVWCDLAVGFLGFLELLDSQRGKERRHSFKPLWAFIPERGRLKTEIKSQWIN